MPDEDTILASDAWFAGVNTERRAIIAYIKAEAQRLYDLGEDQRAAVDALAQTAFAIKCGSHWTENRNYGVATRSCLCQ